MHTYIYTYIHTYLHTYIHTYIHTYTYLYVYIYICPSLSLCLSVSVSLSLSLSLCTWLLEKSPCLNQTEFAASVYPAGSALIMGGAILRATRGMPCLQAQRLGWRRAQRAPKYPNMRRVPETLIDTQGQDLRCPRFPEGLESNLNLKLKVLLLETASLLL